MILFSIGNCYQNVEIRRRITKYRKDIIINQHDCQ